MSKVSEGSGLLASLSPNEDYLFVNKYSNNSYKGHITASSSQNTTLLSPRTLADKCSWTPGNNVLLCGVPSNLTDINRIKDWYQGRVSFTDSLFILNPDNQSQSNLFNEEEYNQGPFDIINISTDPTFNFVTFQNKRTGQLWGFEL